MKTRLTLRPGQNGTKKLVAKYGERLLTVRYRYDERRRMRLKTVELVEEQFPWDPPYPVLPEPEEIVQVSVDMDEHLLRAALKRAGARFDWETKTWRLPYREVCALKLAHRVVV